MLGVYVSGQRLFPRHHALPYRGQTVGYGHMRDLLHAFRGV
jgi:hypothetical protein